MQLVPSMQTLQSEFGAKLSFSLQQQVCKTSTWLICVLKIVVFFCTKNQSSDFSVQRSVKRSFVVFLFCFCLLFLWPAWWNQMIKQLKQCDATMMLVFVVVFFATIKQFNYHIMALWCIGTAVFICLFSSKFRLYFRCSWVFSFDEQMMFVCFGLCLGFSDVLKTLCC